MKETDYENLTVFEQVNVALGQALAQGRGELNLKTTTLPLPPPPAARRQIIALRKKLKMSQSVFAAALNVSTKLVQSWEQGTRKPDRGELRLIEILIKQPDLVSTLILGQPAQPAKPKATRPAKRAPRKRAAAA